LILDTDLFLSGITNLARPVAMASFRTAYSRIERRAGRQIRRTVFSLLSFVVMIAAGAALAASEPRDASQHASRIDGWTLAQAPPETGVVKRRKPKPAAEQPPPPSQTQPSSPGTAAPPPSAAIPALPPSAIPSSGSVIVSQPMLPDPANAAAPPEAGATGQPRNVAERVLQSNVGVEKFRNVLRTQEQAVEGWGKGAPMSHQFFDQAAPRNGPIETVTPQGSHLLEPAITPNYKPTTKQDAEEILRTHPSIGGGIDLEGTATGLGPIKRIQYHAALNALMLDDRAAYFFPVAGRNVAVLCRAIAQQDLVGVSMAVGGVRLTYGKIPKESELAIQLTLADSFLGNIVFADDSLAGYVFADGYTPKQAQASSFFPILVHFTFGGYRFEIADQQIRATNFSFSDELFPISKNKGMDGGMLPDYDAIAQGKKIPEFEANAQHLASHTDHYRKERIVELAFQYGEVAALLRGLKASGVDLNALAQSIEIAVGTAPQTSPAAANADDTLQIEHEWAGYLKEIQQRHHYENWSAPPYDLYVKRLAQSRARAVQTFRVTRVAANDVLYIRSGPDPGLAAVGSIPPDGRGVRIVGACTGQWCQVDYNGVGGWTNGYYLQPEPNQAAAIYRVTGVAADDVLNVREGPGARYPIVGTLPPDARGVRLASTVECVGVWCQANFQNASGWVNTQYLGTDMPNAATTFRVINVASDDVLNIRSEPNSSSSIVGSIPPNGRGVRIAGTCNGQWCPVDFHGIHGWVNKQYLADDL
jgi:uncharacterized protein YraI